MYDTTIATKLLGQLKAFLGRISPHFSKAVARGHLRSGALFKHMFPIGGDSSCVEHRAGKHMFHGGRMACRTKTHVNDSGDVRFLRRDFSAWNTFRATRLPSDASASKTSPMPPFPSRRILR